MREIEYDLWFIAKALLATKDRYAKKSHVYIFQDEKEWKQFLTDTRKPEWFASFAHSGNLFLHVGGMGEGFDSHLLAHETTHAVVARLFPNRNWPVWLNEGFAEYMGGASVAARKKQFVKGMEKNLQHAVLSFQDLTAMTEYPQDRQKVHELYQSSEKAVRFLMTEFPKEQFPKFVEAILGGADFKSAVEQIYGDQIQDFSAFQSKYARFDK